MRTTHHVIPNLKGQWEVRRSGTSRPSRVFPTRREAESYARRVARKAGSDVYIHRASGTVIGWHCYSGDPPVPATKQ